MKNKIKKLKLPLNKMTGAEKERITPLLENINNNIKLFMNSAFSANGINKKNIKKT